MDKPQEAPNVESSSNTPDSYDTGMELRNVHLYLHKSACVKNDFEDLSCTWDLFLSTAKLMKFKLKLIFIQFCQRKLKLNKTLVPYFWHIISLKLCSGF